MGSSQSSIVHKLGSSRPSDVTEALRLLKTQVQSSSVFNDPRFFRAVIPPLANLLGGQNNQKELKLAALRDLSFLTVRPANVTQDTVNANLGDVVDYYLVAPIILGVFSPDMDIRAASLNAIDALVPVKALFGLNNLAEVVSLYVKVQNDETVIHILLSMERSGHLKAQFIAEFRRILHEEPTVLDGALSTQLFYSLHRIISTHNPSDVDVLVDFSYGCLMKLIPQRRSVLGVTLLKSVADVAAATLSQPTVSPQYLDINTCLVNSVIDACDEASVATISAVCVSVSRHFCFIVNSRSLDDQALIRLSTSVLSCFSAILAWNHLPSFQNWSQTFYKAISVTMLVSLLSGNEQVCNLASSLLSRCSTATGQYLQFFIGDFSLAFVVHIARLLHPSNLKSPPQGRKSPDQQRSMEQDSELPFASILDALYSLPTTAERLHRHTKDALLTEMVFLVDYPLSMVAQTTDENSAYAKFQIELWSALNLIRVATYHILLCLMRLRGRSQQQLVELFTIWYDRMSFTGHFILVDVLNKALMSILVKADGMPIPMLAAPHSSSGLNTSNPANMIQSPLALPSTVQSSSSAVSQLAPLQTLQSVSASTSSVLMRASLSPSTPAASSSAPSPVTLVSPHHICPPPHNMAISADAERNADLQRRIQEMEQEIKAMAIERTQMATQLSEKSKEVSTILNEKEQLLNQIACAVCLENILDNKPVCLDCGHLFCGSCVDDVMRSHNKCPLCKAAIGRVVQVKGL